MARAIAATAVLALAGPAAASPGRTVRVEATHKATRVESTVCGELRVDLGMCIGPRPAIGDHILMADSQGAFELEIRTVEPLASLVNPGSTRPVPDVCRGLMWQVTTSPHAAHLPHSGNLFGIVGNYDPRIVRSVEADKLTAPTGIAEDHIMGAIDLDGDAQSDVMLGMTSCPATKRHCLAVWDRQGDKFVATSVIPLELCAN